MKIFSFSEKNRHIEMLLLLINQYYTEWKKSDRRANYAFGLLIELANNDDWDEFPANNRINDEEYRKISNLNIINVVNFLTERHHLRRFSHL